MELDKPPFCPGPDATVPARDQIDRLRSYLYQRLRGRSMPILLGPDYAIPGASLWSGIRVWTKRFRDIGVAPGDSIVIALPAVPALAMACGAAWWIGATTVHHATDHVNGVRVAPETAKRPQKRRLLVATREAGITPDISPDISWNPVVHRSLHACDVSGTHGAALGEHAAVFPETTGHTGVTWSELLRELVRNGPLSDPDDGSTRDADIHPNAWHTPRGLLRDLWSPLLNSCIVRAPGSPMSLAHGFGESSFRANADGLYKAPSHHEV